MVQRPIRSTAADRFQDGFPRVELREHQEVFEPGDAVSLATPWPGTSLFDLAKREGWVAEERLEDYTSYVPSMRVHPDLDHALLTRKANEAYRRFYASPRRVLRELTSAGFLAGLARSMAPVRGRA